MSKNKPKISEGEIVINSTHILKRKTDSVQNTKEPHCINIHNLERELI